MKKVIYLSAIAAVALAGCTNDDTIVSNENELNTSDGISFRMSAKMPTRAEEHVGADAATKLNNQFVVSGFKGASSVPNGTGSTVFNHYKVEYTANTAGKTESNTADWEYVGITPLADYGNGETQTIKYWDYKQDQYDFIAYSTSDATVIHGETPTPTDGKLYVTAITPTSATSSTGGAYKVAGSTAQLSKFYIADLVTIPRADYSKEVKITFRNIAAKVRIGLYETIPGYSIKDVKFYVNGTEGSPSAGTSGTLYSSSANIYTKGTYTVYYPTVNSTEPTSDKNKAHVVFAATGDQASYQSFGELNLVRAQGSTHEEGGKYLGIASNSATYPTNSSEKPYTTVLPNESATSLTLRCDYTLISDDGSKEEIVVHGATAVVPAIYCQWKSNYAYTYLFKISDNTNGVTDDLNNTNGSLSGLHPITFDAATIETEDGIQETVTTVATPSITTYCADPNVNVTEKNEYPANKTVYVMVQDGATLKGDLGTYGKLYTVTTTGTAITEATVHDALTIGAGGSGVASRNGITLTNAESDATITAIPGADGNNITVGAGTAASFTTGAAGTVYAYVYETTPSPAPAAVTFNTAVILTGASAPSDFTSAYYKDFACENLCAAGDYTDGGTYYQEITNNKKTFAVKVIKVAE